MTTNTTTRATCEHDNRDYLGADCLAQQIVECADCGATWEERKAHRVFKFTLHAEFCTRRAVPASWCGCETRKAAGCTDCDKEFPRDVEAGPEVELYN